MSRRRQTEAEALRGLAGRADVVNVRAGWLASLLASNPQHEGITGAREELLAALTALDTARDEWIRTRNADTHARWIEARWREQAP